MMETLLKKGDRETFVSLNPFLALLVELSPPWDNKDAAEASRASTTARLAPIFRFAPEGF
jgi:hypothetical protein